MIFYDSIFRVAASVLVVKVFFGLEKRLEKRLVSRHPKVKGKIIEHRSRRAFKLLSIVCQSIAVIETSNSMLWNVYLFASATVFVLLRCLAITEMKEFWSFDVEYKYKHQLVCTGIYKFLDHPAYVGNLFIPCFFLSIGANISAALASLLLIVFYFYRVSFEDGIVKRLKDCKQRRKTLPLLVHHTVAYSPGVVIRNHHGEVSK